jgi:TRAP-type C4-dicarboxylate transport system permease small subunit
VAGQTRDLAAAVFERRRLMPDLSALKQASYWVNQGAIAVCIACVLVMLGISFTGFLYTVFTGGALSWTYSLARVFLPWIGLISITIAFYAGEHVAMTILVKLLPPVLLRAIAIVCLAVIAIFAVMLIWYGWQFFLNARQTYMVSAHIQIPQYYTAIAVPITGAITLLHLVHGVSLLEHQTTPDEAYIDEALRGTAGDES